MIPRERVAAADLAAPGGHCGQVYAGARGDRTEQMAQLLGEAEIRATIIERDDDPAAWAAA